ncbi:assimilatory nitrate reductase electron transfer subunit [Gracilibacillus halophilus YIM-C55.5]|uniref:Assimilatory nitrate reductase electron transfer subunit n=1 Tax=Gracilibacillus halophilus YIM-C55.5 TaxID=1308866 RepID=N4WLW8_9BACI|nr:hypothetical protein [Gracilibacillus halophilus]ENH97152.1 assimilatory nitrate reductase electron transfer subunit [Gracilibacillus halophilus YIM-C55.5]
MESQETPSSSSLLFTGHKEEDTLFFVLGIIQYYRQSAFFKESITDWITRLGIVHIREVLFDERLRHELNENLSSDQRTHKKSSVTLMK